MIRVISPVHRGGSKRDPKSRTPPRKVIWGDVRVGYEPTGPLDMIQNLLVVFVGTDIFLQVVDL